MARIDRARPFAALSAFLVGAIFAGAATAQTLPQNGTVVGGSGSIQQTGPNLQTIQQNSDRLAIDWQSFSVGPNGVVRFVQPNSGASALNRVVGADPSQIMGRVQANGQVILVNPNGILFGAGSAVDVNGLIATTGNIRNSEFMAGRLNFDEGSPNPDARVVNRGAITVGNGGSAVLSGAGVSNEGTIVATAGTVVLGGTKTFTVDFAGDGLLKFAPTGPVEQRPAGANALVDNSGTIQADGGRVILSGRAAKNVLDNVINNTGIVQARAIRQVGGTIVFDGGDNGAVNVAGTVDATGRNAGERGGKVSLAGNSLLVTGTVDAGGSAAGGSIAMQGQDIRQQGQVRADATAGTGGTVEANFAKNFWSAVESTTSARGGGAGNSGGSVRIQGTDAGATLQASGNINVDGAAGNGGSVKLLADNVGVMAGANVTATGATGGGEVLVGGNYRGAGPEPNARIVYMDARSVIDASAVNGGNGGRVILWADDTTRAAGSIKVRGGAGGGDGGFVEVSAKRSLAYAGTVALGAPAGRAGRLLLDPNDITISASDTNITASTPFEAAGAGASTLSVAALLAALASGDVTISTAAGSGGNGDITVASAVSFVNTTGPVTLSLIADRDININANLGTGVGSTSAMNIVLNANSQALSDGSGAGRVSIGSGVAITTNGGYLTIGGGYSGLGDALPTIGAIGRAGAVDGVAINNASIDTAGGNVWIYGRGFDTGTAAKGVYLTAGSIASGAGSVTISGIGGDGGGSGTANHGVAFDNAHTITTTSGIVSVTGIAGDNSFNSAGIDIGSGGASITSTTGDITFLGTSSATPLGLAMGVNTVGNASLSTAGITTVNSTGTLYLGPMNVGTGAVTLSAPNYGIVQSGPFVQAAGGGLVTLDAANGFVQFDDPGNVFTGSVAATSSGGTNPISIASSTSLTLDAVSSAGDLTLATGGPLTFNGPVTVGGNLLAATDALGPGGTISQTATGTISVVGGSTFSAGAAAISLPETGNDFQSVVLLSNTGANNVTLATAGALNLNAVAVGGDLTLNPGSSLTTSTGLAVGGAFTLTTPVSTFLAAGTYTVGGGSAFDNVNQSGAVTISATGPVTIGTVSAGGFDLTLNGAGGIYTLNGPVTGVNNFTIASSGGIAFAGSVSTVNLSATAAGPITQSAAILTTGNASFAAGANAITLADPSNDFQGVVTLTNSGPNNVALATGGALTFGTVNVGGNLTISPGTSFTAAGLTVGGAFTLTVPVGTTLNAGTYTVGAGSVLPDATLGGNVIVSSGGAVQVGGITGGGFDLNLGGAGASYTLAGTISGVNALTVNNTGALDFANPVMANSVTATASGPITQAASLIVGGNASFNAGANAITLNDPSNDFQGTLSLANTGANNVAVASGGAMTLGTVTVGGDLTVAPGTSFAATGMNVGGAFTMSSPVATTFGAGTYTIGTGSVLPDATLGGAVTVTSTGAVTLGAVTGAGNNLTLGGGGTYTLAGAVSGVGAFTLADAGPVALAFPLSATSVAVTAGGPISQTAALTVTGVASFDAGANTITLTYPSNDFQGSVSLATTGANDASIVTVNALTLGTVAVGGNLSAGLSGNLTLAGMNVGGTFLSTGQTGTTLNAGTYNVGGGSAFGAATLGGAVNVISTGAVTLGTVAGAGNDLTLGGGGTYALTGAVTGVNAFTLADSGPVTFANAVNAGSLNVTAGGPITQTAPLTVAGASSFAAGANAIDLSMVGNALSGAVSVSNSAGTVDVRNAGALTLGTVSVGPGAATFTADAGGISQTGAFTQAAGGGAVTFAAPAGAILLTNAANSFTGVVNASNAGNNAITIVASGPLTLGDVSMAPASTAGFTAQATGGISQSTANAIVAGTGASSIDGGSGALAVDGAANVFGGALTIAGDGGTMTAGVAGLSGADAANAVTIAPSAEGKAFLFNGVPILLASPVAPAPSVPTVPSVPSVQPEIPAVSPFSAVVTQVLAFFSGTPAQSAVVRPAVAAAMPLPAVGIEAPSMQMSAGIIRDSSTSPVNRSDPQNQDERGTTAVPGVAPAPGTQNAAPAAAGGFVAPVAVDPATAPRIVVSDSGAGAGGSGGLVRATPQAQPQPTSLIPGVLTANPTPIPVATTGGAPGISQSFPQGGNPSLWPSR